MNAKDEVTVSLTDMTNRLKNSIKLDFEVERMEPLFATEEDYEAFNKRQDVYKRQIWCCPTSVEMIASPPVSS